MKPAYSYRLRNACTASFCFLRDRATFHLQRESLTANNDLIAMFNNNAQIVLLAATAKNQYRDWKVIHKEAGPWNGEPLPDLSRWREEGVLSIYMQKDPSKGGEPTDLYVVDFGIAETGSNRTNR